MFGQRQWHDDGFVFPFSRRNPDTVKAVAFASWVFALALRALPLAAAQHPAPPEASRVSGAARDDLGKLQVKPGQPVTARPAPPRAGRDRCIGINTVAGAEMFGDRGIELTMKDGRKFRMFLGRDCPALSFYQGFYYRRGSNGQLCAGRDAIGARSGGECPIASIIPVRRFRR